MAKHKGKAKKIPPKCLKDKKAQLFEPLNIVLPEDNTVSLFRPPPTLPFEAQHMGSGNVFQRGKVPCFDLVVSHCSPHDEPVSMLPPGAEETPVKSSEISGKGKKRNRTPAKSSKISGNGKMTKRSGNTSEVSVSMLPPGAEETPVKSSEISGKGKKRKKTPTKSSEFSGKGKKTKRSGNTSEVSGKSNKSKRIGYNTHMKKKIEALSVNVNPIPFSPSKNLDLEAHKCLLKNLGLWDFVNVDFGNVVVSGLIEEFVANYNPKRPLDRATFVDGYPITVSQSALASVLRIPTKMKLSEQSDALKSVVLVVSKKEARFIEKIIWHYMVLQDSYCQIPDEVMGIVGLVRERKIQEVDWAGLMWFMMKKELLEGVKLRNCRYASHMQSLVQYHFDENARLMKMGSAARSKGHVANNQLQISDGNEKTELVNELFLENCSVDVIKTMDDAQLSCCTTMKKGSLVEGSKLGGQYEVCVEVGEEAETVIGDEIRSVHENQDLEVENQYKDLMTQLFDEAENEGSKGMVVNEVVENRQKEDDSMDMQTDNLSWHDHDDMHSVETSCQQQVGFVFMLNKTSTDFLSDDVVVEDEAIEADHKDVFPTKGTSMMMAANDYDDDQHSSERTSQHSVLDGEDHNSEVLITENIVSSTEHVCGSERSAAVEPEYKDTISITCQQARDGVDVMLDVLIAEKNIAISEQVCVSDKGDVMELEHLHRLSKGDEQNVQKDADFGAQIHSVGRNQCVSEAQGVNAAIVLESDDEEEMEQQLNRIDGVLHHSSLECVEEVEAQTGNSHQLDMDLETVPQFYDENACNEQQPLNLDSCAQQVDIWLSSFKPVPNELIIEDLQAKLAEQIQVSEQWKLENEMMNREITRHAKQLHLADSLVNDYKKMMKQMDRSFAEHRRQCQQPEESQYRDHPDGNGLLITVAEWEKLMQDRRDQETRKRILSMFNGFQADLTGGLEGCFHELDSLCDRVSVCGESLNLLKSKASRS